MARKPKYPTLKDTTTEADPAVELPADPAEAPEPKGDDYTLIDVSGASQSLGTDAPPPFSPLFDAALPLTLKHEGGFVEHPADPGGATNLGVSLRYAKSRGSLFDLDRDGDVDADDIRLVTVETAKPFYHDDFWKTVRGDELPPGLGYAVFDASVHSGPNRAIRFLQAAVGTTVDGSFGPATLAAVRADRDPLLTIERVCTARMSFLRTLTNWNDFKRGWTARIGDVIQSAHRMALAQ